jgi:hypothetical protein
MRLTVAASNLGLPPRLLPKATLRSEQATPQITPANVSTSKGDGLLLVSQDGSRKALY